MGFKKINSLKVSLFTHLVVALVFSIIFSFAVQNIAGHMKETIWLEYIDADELYEFQNKYSSQFGGMISVPQVMNSEMDKVDQFWVGVCEFMESWSVFILTFTRQGEDTQEITVKVSDVELPSVFGEMLDENTGYIQIT